MKIKISKQQRRKTANFPVDFVSNAAQCILFTLFIEQLNGNWSIPNYCVRSVIYFLFICNLNLKYKFKKKKRKETLSVEMLSAIGNWVMGHS